MKVKIIFILAAIIGSILPVQALEVRDSLVTTKKYEQYVERSYTSLSQSKPDSAQLYIEKALQLLPNAPTNYMLRANLSKIYLSKRDTAQAIIQLTLAIAQQPNEPILHEERGTLYALTGKLNEALFDYDNIIKQYPDRESARYNRALIRSSLGLDDAAESDLQHIVQLNPKAYQPRLAMAEIEIKRGAEDQAEKIYTYLINTFPAELEAYRARARLYITQDRKALAMKDVQTIISQGKGLTAEDYLLRGVIWLMYDEKKEASADFRQARSMGATEQQINAIREYLRR